MAEDMGDEVRPGKEFYLGDGLYASFDGYSIIAPRHVNVPLANVPGGGTTEALRISADEKQ